ncbi:efflux RND transporter periplasmic adaptor subunit [Halothiobacillus sp. DCM-1]|uniref:efflux RND transporter periplasmic adaptor subunit n=1 Tax=Halothiobacillus sp. DCM-1 TaxID=3112558 RepID=UPI0032446FDC
MFKFVLPLLLLLIAGSGVAWYVEQENNSNSATATRAFYGNMDLRQVDLAFNDAGRISDIFVQTGDPVRAGQPIAKLDTRRFDAALAAAQAQLAANQAIYEKLVHGSRPEDIERLRAVVAADQANLQLRERTEARLTTLTQQKLASPQDLDTARAQRAAAAAQLKADQAQLQLAVIGNRPEDIAAAKASVEAATAAVHSAQIARDDTVLTAPSAGIISNRLLEPGDMASPAQPVISLALTNPRWARIYLAESDLGWIHEGMPATIHSDSFPDRSFAGWVGYISPTAEFTPKAVESPSVRTALVYQARVYVCDPADQPLRLGMPVTVKIARDARPVARGADPCAPEPAAP